jgi:hypothetical protein
MIPFEPMAGNAVRGESKGYIVINRARFSVLSDMPQYHHLHYLVGANIKFYAQA